MVGRVSRAGDWFRSEPPADDDLPVDGTPMTQARSGRAAARRAGRRHRLYLATWCSPRAPRPVTDLNDIGQTLVPLCIAGRALVAAGRRSTGRLRTSLVPPRGGAPSAGGSARRCGPGSRSSSTSRCPTPGLADVGYLGAIPFLLAGVLTFPSQSLADDGSGPRGARRPHHDVRDALRQLRHVPRRRVRGERGRRPRARRSPSPTPPPTSSRWRWSSPCWPGGASAWSGPLPARGRRHRVAGGRRQRLRLHDRQGHLRRRSRHRPRLAPRVRACSPWPAWIPERAVAAEEARRPSGSAFSDVACRTSRSSPASACSSPASFSGAASGRSSPSPAASSPCCWSAGRSSPMLENRQLTRHLEHTVTELQEREGQLQFQAFHDPLTRWRTGRCSATGSTTPSSSGATSRSSCCSSTSTTSRP